MKLTDKLTQEEKKDENVCQFCGHSKPYHSLKCQKVINRFCPACKCMHPRHYPNCPMDIYGIGRWWINQYMQKEMIDMWMLERQTQPAAREPIPKHSWFVGDDKMLKPVDSHRIMKAIYELMKAESKEEKELHRAAIHEEVERLAGKK
jgi:hypothetical protein